MQLPSPIDVSSYRITMDQVFCPLHLNLLKCMRKTERLKLFLNFLLFELLQKRKLFGYTSILFLFITIEIYYAEILSIQLFAILYTAISINVGSKYKAIRQDLKILWIFYE